jgi:hypothetical protein
MGQFDFSKVGKAKMSERGEPLTPNQRNTGAVDDKGKPIVEKYAANYLLKIRRCLAKRSRAGKDFFIAEFEVVQSDNPEQSVGTKRTWMQDINIDAGPGALKGFMVACLGIDYRSAEGKAKINELEDNFDAICTEALEDESDPACENAFAGTFVKCEVKEIDTNPKVKGGEPGKFNLHTFSPGKDPSAKAA